MVLFVCMFVFYQSQMFPVNFMLPDRQLAAAPICILCAVTLEFLEFSLNHVCL